MSVDHRRVTAQVTVPDSAGHLVRDADVTVEQQRHDLVLGNIGFDVVPMVTGETEQDAAVESVLGGAGLAGLPDLEAVWLELLTPAPLPFSCRGFEPTRRTPGARRPLRAASWLAERAVTVKELPLTWHTSAPEWLTGLPVAEIERLQRERIRHEVSDLSGVVDTWDAIDGAVIILVFTAQENGVTRLAQSIGRVPVIRLAFEEARASNPSTTLVPNDCDLSSEDEALIEGVLHAAFVVDAIGLQRHLHQGYWGDEAMSVMIDRSARVGLPLHSTGTTPASGGSHAAGDPRPRRLPGPVLAIDARPGSQASGGGRPALPLTREPPAVQAITYRGFTDDGAWLAAPGGLVRADGTPKPSFHALRSLIKGKGWLPRTTMRTDRDARSSITGFFGGDVIERDGQSAPVPFSRGGGTATVRCRRLRERSHRPDRTHRSDEPPGGPERSRPRSRRADHPLTLRRSSEPDHHTKAWERISPRARSRRAGRRIPAATAARGV